jgi:hypothetical protein
MGAVHVTGGHITVAQRVRDRSTVVALAGTVKRKGREGYMPHWATWKGDEN